MPEAKVLRYVGGTVGKGYEWWREEFCRQIMNCEIVPIGQSVIDVAITSVRIPAVNLVSADGTTLNYTTLGKVDDLVLLLPTTTTVSVKLANHEALLNCGVLSIADAGQFGCSVVSLESGNFHSAFFNRRGLMDVCPRVEEVIAQPVVGGFALLSLFQSYHETI